MNASAMQQQALLQLIHKLVLDPQGWSSAVALLRFDADCLNSIFPESFQDDRERWVFQAFKQLAEQGNHIDDALDVLEYRVLDIRFFGVIISVGETLLQHQRWRMSVEDRQWVHNRLGNAHAQIPFGSRYDHQLLAIYHFWCAFQLPPGNDLAESQILANMGNVYHEILGRGRNENLKRAQECLSRSLDRLKRAHSQNGLDERSYRMQFASLANSLGNIERDQHVRNTTERHQQLDQSLYWFEQGAACSNQGEMLQSDLLRNRAVSLLSQASLLDESQELIRQSLRLLDAASEISTRHKQPFWDALCLSLKACALGRLSPGTEETVAATRATFRRCLQVFQELGHRREAVTAQLNWGIFEESQDEELRAWSCYRDAIQLSEQEWQAAQSTSAKLAWAEQYADALDHYVRTSARLANQQSMREMPNALWSPAQFKQECFAWMERGTARLMTEWTLSQQHADARSAAERLKACLDTINLSAPRNVDQNDLDQAARAVRENVVEEWLTTSPDHSVETNSFTQNPQSISIEELGSSLTESEIPVLLLRVTAKGTVCSLVAPGTLDCCLIETFQHQDLSRLLQTWSCSLRNLPQWIRQVQISPTAEDFGMCQVLRELRHLLWVPVIEWVNSVLGRLPANLVVVPGPGLSVLPLHAANEQLELKDGMEDHESNRMSLSYSSNLRIFNRCSQQSTRLRAGESFRSLLISNPTDDLEFGTWECERLLRILPQPPVVLAGRNQSRYPVAEKEVVLRHLQVVDVAIFATHATFNPVSPWNRSRILLSRHSGKHSLRRQRESSRGIEILNDILATEPVQFPTPVESTQQDQAPQVASPFESLNDPKREGDALTLEDLFQSTIRSSLIVLSACQSALTDQDDLTSETIGFPSALIAAGARTVIGSLWKVDDRATAMFNCLLFQQLLNQDQNVRTGDIAQAVRGAQRQIRTMDRETLSRHFPGVAPSASTHPFSHPVFWSPFACYGAP